MFLLHPVKVLLWFNWHILKILGTQVPLEKLLYPRTIYIAFFPACISTFITCSSESSHFTSHFLQIYSCLLSYCSFTLSLLHPHLPITSLLIQTPLTAILLLFIKNHPHTYPFPEVLFCICLVLYCKLFNTGNIF